MTRTLDDWIAQGGPSCVRQWPEIVPLIRELQASHIRLTDLDRAVRGHIRSEEDALALIAGVWSEPLEAVRDVAAAEIGDEWK